MLLFQFQPTLTYRILMAKLKTYLVNCTGGRFPALTAEIQAVNPIQAQAFAKARYPTYTKWYTTSEKRGK